jgi:hypothetical protein
MCLKDLQPARVAMVVGEAVAEMLAAAAVVLEISEVLAAAVVLLNTVAVMPAGAVVMVEEVPGRVHKAVSRQHQRKLEGMTAQHRPQDRKHPPPIREFWKARQPRYAACTLEASYLVRMDAVQPVRAPCIPTSQRAWS